MALDGNVRSFLLPRGGSSGKRAAMPEQTGNHGWQCTCEDCRRIRARKKKQRQLTQESLVDADPARIRLQRLADYGVNTETISARVGIDARQISRIRSGSILTTHIEIVDQILEVDVRDFHTRVGSVRSLQALSVRGWPISTVADFAGINSSILFNILAGHVYRTPTHDYIAFVFRHLWDQDPIEWGVPVATALKTRDRAISRGWVAALAWDDLDDPDDVPDTHRWTQPTGEQRLEDLQFLTAQGVEMTEASRRTGWTNFATFQRWCERNNCHTYGHRPVIVDTRVARFGRDSGQTDS